VAKTLDAGPKAVRTALSADLKKGRGKGDLLNPDGTPLCSGIMAPAITSGHSTPRNVKGQEKVAYAKRSTNYSYSRTKGKA